MPSIFEHVVLALVHSSGYERISTPGCSDRTIRRLLREWSQQGISKTLHALALDAYDRMIGLDLGEISWTAASPRPRPARRRPAAHHRPVRRSSRSLQPHVRDRDQGAAAGPGGRWTVMIR